MTCIVQLSPTSWDVRRKQITVHNHFVVRNRIWSRMIKLFKIYQSFVFLRSGIQSVQKKKIDMNRMFLLIVFVIQSNNDCFRNKWIRWVVRILDEPFAFHFTLTSSGKARIFHFTPSLQLWVNSLEVRLLGVETTLEANFWIHTSCTQLEKIKKNCHRSLVNKHIIPVYVNDRFFLTET